MDVLIASHVPPHSLSLYDWIQSDIRVYERQQTQFRPNYVSDILCAESRAEEKEAVCRLLSCIIHALCLHEEHITRTGMCVLRCSEVMLVLDEACQSLTNIVVLHKPDDSPFSKIYNVRGHRQLPFSLALSLYYALNQSGAHEYIDATLYRFLDAATNGICFRNEVVAGSECAPVASGLDSSDVCELLLECTYKNTPESEPVVGTPPITFEVYDLSERAELFDRFATPRRKQSDLTLEGSLAALSHIDSSPWPETLKAMSRRAVCISAQASQRPGCFVTDADLIPEEHLVWYDIVCARHLLFCNDSSPRRQHF